MIVEQVRLRGKRYSRKAKKEDRSCFRRIRYKEGIQHINDE